MNEQQIYILACKDKLVKRWNFTLLHWDVEQWNEQVRYMRSTMTPKNRARALEDYS